MRRFIENVGGAAAGAIEFAGGAFVLFLQTLYAIARPPFRGRQIYQQMVRIGVDSLPIATLTSFFIGVVIAFQSAYQMQRVNAEMYIPSLVAISI